MPEKMKQKIMKLENMQNGGVLSILKMSDENSHQK